MNSKPFELKFVMRIACSIFLITLFSLPLEAHEPAEGTLNQIKKSGKIRIGFRASQPPMSFLGKDGNPTGYSIDLCKRIVTGVKNKLGTDVSVEYIPVTAKERFEALINNEIDILCGATTKTISRGELVDFTQLTFVTGASLMTLKDKKLSDLSGLNGRKIGVVRNTTTIEALKNLLEETLTDADIVPFEKSADGLDALRRGSIDAFSSDQIVLIGLITEDQNPDNFSIAKDVFSFEPFALAVRRNDASFRLVADSAISHLYRSGQILQIYDKWIGRFIEKRPPVFDALFQLNATPE